MNKSTKLLKALNDIDEKFLMEDYKTSENVNFEEIGDDEKMDKSNLKKFSIKKIIIAIMSAIAILAATPVIANTIQKMLRNYSYGINIQEEPIRMDYVNKDDMYKDEISDEDIKVKANSFNLTEDYLGITLSFLFNKDILEHYYNLGYDNTGLTFDYVIYDENKIVYNSYYYGNKGYEDEELKTKLKKELGLKSDEIRDINRFSK